MFQNVYKYYQKITIHKKTIQNMTKDLIRRANKKQRLKLIFTVSILATYTLAVHLTKQIISHYSIKCLPYF